MIRLKFSKKCGSIMQGRLEGSEAGIKVDNEDLLLTVQVDDESWHSASDPAEEEGINSKDFQKIDLTVLGIFWAVREKEESALIWSVSLGAWVDGPFSEIWSRDLQGWDECDSILLFLYQLPAPF